MRAINWGRRRMCLPAGLALGAGWAAPSLAHTGERGQIMLLPTPYYIAGGALAVAASVLVLALLPRRPGRLPSWDVELRDVPERLGVLPSLASLSLIILLAVAGFWGPPDPISNPLPGFIWSLWWVGFTFLCMIFGNLWPAFNPWTGVLRLIAFKPPLRYPTWFGHWPAVAMLFGFVWFELVYPAPEDPPRLAMAVAIYLAVNFTGALIFGAPDWLDKSECFSVYFKLIGRLSPLQRRNAGGKVKLEIGIPGSGLVKAARGVSEAAFVLLALSSVSFDGLSRTFFWAGQLGLNPLEFPGRSAVVLPNTMGLILVFLCLSAAYAIATMRQGLVLVMSLVPIAFAYHFAHYLPDFPVAAKRAVKALSDPFGTGLDLLGTGSLQPPASIMLNHGVAAFIFRVQTAIIAIGHIGAVLVAHHLPAAGTARSQIPLNILMILYTVFGLWLLSTPVIS